MSKYILFFIIIAILTAAGFVFVNQAKSKNPKNITVHPLVSPTQAIEKIEIVDYKASFAIFTNGVFRVFTAPMYHNQSDDVFIEAVDPNIIHVKKGNVSWNNFFATLPFKLNNNCLTTGTGETFCTNNKGNLRFYLNSIEDQDALNKQIRARDKLLVTYGNENEQQIKIQLQKVPAVK